MPTHAVPGSSSGQSVGSPNPALPHTTCAPGYSDTSSWRRPQSADETGCARESSAAQMSTRSRSWPRNTFSPLSAPVRPPLPIWPRFPSPTLYLFIFIFCFGQITIIKKKNDNDIKSRPPQGNLSQVVGDHRPSQRLAALVVVPPRADSEKEAPMRIIRRRESSCAPLHTLSTKTMDFVNALALLRCWSATHTNAQLPARQAQTRLPVRCSM
jgi:hypothetical protein